MKLKMDTLASLLALSDSEKELRGLVHTPREVVQQPATWIRTYQKILHLAPSIKSFLTKAGVPDRHSTILLVGAGTSDYIGKSVCALLQRQWRCDVHAVASTDLLTNLEDHILDDRSYLWFSFSRSGDSSEGVAVLHAALERYPNIQHIVITCNEGGQMARSFRDYENVYTLILDEEINDKGLAMTSSFSNMVVAAQVIANIQDLAAYEVVLRELAKAADLVLDSAEICERLVTEGFTKACFLGTGSLKGAAIECALKVLELTNGQVTSFAESFLGVRHGPLSAIDNDTLLVGFVSSDPKRRAFEMDLLKEVSDKRLTDKTLLVSPDRKVNNPQENRLFLGLSPEVSDLYRPPLDVIVGQLIGLFASLREGLKPDNPSPCGAINRVVNSVTIY